MFSAIGKPLLDLDSVYLKHLDTNSNCNIFQSASVYVLSMKSTAFLCWKHSWLVDVHHVIAQLTISIGKNL